MLSGGLNAANIGEALRLANPPGIDISSGVESAPGVKEPALIDDFLPGRAGRGGEPRRLEMAGPVYFLPRKGLSLGNVPQGQRSQSQYAQDFR